MTALFLFYCGVKSVVSLVEGNGENYVKFCNTIINAYLFNSGVTVILVADRFGPLITYPNEE